MFFERESKQLIPKCENKLAQLDVKPIQNALCALLSVHLAAIACADILHNILLTVQKNMREWIQSFLDKNERLAVFD